MKEIVEWRVREFKEEVEAMREFTDDRLKCRCWGGVRGGGLGVV